MSSTENQESSSAFGMMSRTEEGDDEEEEENDDGGVWFYVNKSGFPMNRFTYDRMWNHVSKIHPEGFRIMHQIKDLKDLPEVPVPQAPLNLPSAATVSEKLSIIQKYMSDLQYNHTGTQFYEIRKHRPVSGLMDVAKEMIKESLPIKCLEAVILGIYLSNGIPGLDRFPVSFRTEFNSNIYNHVVLGVYYNGLYGSIGMSRRKDLMDKPLVFKSLSDLVLDFKSSYNNYWHEVKKVAIGVPVPHNPHSYEQIEWRGFNMHTRKHTWMDIFKELDRYAREIRVQTKKWEAMSSLYSPRKGKVIGELPHRKSRRSSNKLKLSSKNGRRRSSKSKHKVVVKKSETSLSSSEDKTRSSEDEDVESEEESEVTEEKVPMAPLPSGFQMRI